MNEAVKISVIIPVFNIEKYLPSCLASIEAQSFKEYELILVDDGSPDKCGEICDSYAESHKNVVVIHQSNQGLSAARNNGLKKARGEYITFIDSDDVVSTDYLEILYREIIKYDADISTGRLYPFWGEDTAVFKKKIAEDYSVCIYDTQKALEEMLYGSKYGVQGCNKLFKKALVEKFPFPVGKLHEDQGTMYKIIGACKKLVFIDRPFYFYRQRSDSIIHTKVTKDHLYGIEAVNNQLSYVQQYFPDIVNAAEFRMAIVICKWIPGLLSGSKEDREMFEYLRSELMPYYRSIMENKRVTKAMKLRIWAIKNGYGCSRVIVPIIEKMKREKSRVLVRS